MKARWQAAFPDYQLVPARGETLLLLSLDQVWTTPSLRPVRCEHFGSWRSDHRAVVAEIDFVRKD